MVWWYYNCDITVLFSPSSPSDVDECVEGLGLCGAHAHCVNLPGSHRCQCQSGYEFGFDGRTCIGDWSVLLEFWLDCKLSLQFSISGYCLQFTIAACNPLKIMLAQYISLIRSLSCHCLHFTEEIINCNHTITYNWLGNQQCWFI